MSSHEELLKIISENNVGALKTAVKQVDISTLSNAIYTIPNKTSQRPILPNENLTLLHIAACYDSIECFLFLLQFPEFHLRIQSANSYYPLHYACFYASYEICMYILDVDPKIVNDEPEGAQHQYLYFCIVGGDPDIMEMIFKKGVNVRSPKNLRVGIFEKAISVRSIPCLKVLLQHGVSIPKSSGDATFAMRAVINNQPEAVLLLTDSPKDITYINAIGESVFSLMCFSGIAFKPTILKLLNMIPDESIEPPKGIRCQSVVHWLCKLCDSEVAAAMLRTKDVQIHRLDDQGNLGVLQLADKKNTQEVIKIIDLLIENGLNLNFRAEKVGGKYPTVSVLERFIYCISKDYEVIRHLINRGADLNALKKNSNEKLIDAILKGKDKQLIAIVKDHLERIQKKE
ncbi:hypothetical protein TRFO_14360 [Tritrichomonas foetus]|uniref:Uncharacterized protein n=1 Tax=Tritrichomonas foetus TaxID=1144522 RepID=A0A1J4KVK8_9EUKA|nr:hypothetical protein TRFO_14360 [Tritrichomonas foetus]|eukprot:OHT15178.1 hypothetical protein TRFO_14360 [Tritrichomonas foetus]